MNYEGILTKEWNFWFLTYFQSFFYIPSTDMNYSGLLIYPNQSNRAEKYKEMHNNDSQESVNTSDQKNCCIHMLHSYDEKITIDAETVSQALNILRAKFKSDEDKKREEIKEKRLKEISKALQDIKDTLERVMKTTSERA